ncbi:MAG: ribose-phosphate pyrophosphokinase [Clostridia bacterium]|nr:ribose-phosphate pyrophosphokinase [Clostridia bacterium]
MLGAPLSDIKIFAGNAGKTLAKNICANLEMSLGDMDVLRFSDGEVAVNIKETVRGKDVFLVQSTSHPVNENLMELLIIIDALKRASADRITAVIPYFGYARQDWKARARDPISARLVADLITTAGASRVLTMDLHSAQLQGFFDIPLDHLVGQGLLSKYFIQNGYKTEDLVIVAPDVGSVKRARSMATKFNAPIAIIDKRRPKANVMEVMNIIGDIDGKVCIMVDDMIDTAGTICQGAIALRDQGASKVLACCSHGVLSGPAIEWIMDSPIEKLVMLDTIEQPPENLCSKIIQVGVSELFASAISNIYTHHSVSKLFE